MSDRDDRAAVVAELADALMTTDPSLTHADALRRIENALRDVTAGGRRDRLDVDVLDLADALMLTDRSLTRADAMLTAWWETTR